MLKRDLASAVDMQNHYDYAKSLLTEAVYRRLFPGCVYGVVTPNASFVLAVGNHTYEEDSQAVTTGDFFDVASVTKSIPTSVLILRLIDEGVICRNTLDDPLRNYLPEFSGPYSEDVTIRHLLSFGIELNLTEKLESLDDVAEIEGAIMTAGLTRPPGLFRYANSTSFIAMRLIEKLYGMPYKLAAEKFVFDPLGIKGGFLSGNLDLQNVVPTEDGQHGLIHGVVHDEFSRHLFGKNGTISGAAGLFLNGEDGKKILESFCSPDGKQLFGKSEKLFGVSRFGESGFAGQIRTNQLSDPSHIYGLGFDILHDSYGPCACCTKDTMLITGFTGSVIMLQPSRGRGFFLFSNATFPKRHHRTEGRSPLYDLRQKLFHSLQVCKHCHE